MHVVIGGGFAAAAFPNRLAVKRIERDRITMVAEWGMDFYCCFIESNRAESAILEGLMTLIPK